MNELVFFIVILLANIIQGITGFAGTILAMPFGLMLVGYPVAKPVLNLLGWFSGIYVFSGNVKKVNYKELVKILIVMTAGLFAGFLIRSYVTNEKTMYIILGIIVILLAIQGLAKLFLTTHKERPESDSKILSKVTSVALLISSGIVHGMFVCGGPLLIGYVSRKIKDKSEFRATISTVWIFLNGIILATDIKAGMWNQELIKISAFSLPFFFGGMFIGGKLNKKMSQRVFLILTYVLMIISGISLFVK